jgi:hypothetical protein
MVWVTKSANTQAFNVPIHRSRLLQEAVPFPAAFAGARPVQDAAPAIIFDAPPRVPRRAMARTSSGENARSRQHCT